MYISGKKENYYGHNDRERLDYFFAHIDERGIVNIGEELKNGQGGFFINRPYTADQLIETLNYLSRRDPDFFQSLFDASCKYHLTEFANVLDKSTEELASIIERNRYTR